jgi:ABC-type antimicrobial peptide transport system permease subunit
MHGFLAPMLGLMLAIALLLASAGIYSLLSFTISKRSREIGIRAALGADPRRIVTAIFSRALVQIGLGVVAGVLIPVLLLIFGTGDRTSDETARDTGLILGAAALMLVVGLLACVVPARRALRIQPTEALKEG